jgi:hypothetical protein
MKTNLFIAGSCKSGTTFLHDFLGMQEGIFSSNPKEPYFFELPAKNRNIKKYKETYFAEATGNERYWLDSRHRTMFFNWIPKEIKKYNPHAKFIFILRNPIDRAFSHWWMWYSRGIIKKSFYKTIKEEINKNNKGDLEMNKTPEQYLTYVKAKVPQGRLAYADSNTIVESGYYYIQLKRFFEIFEAGQLLILDFNELKNFDSLTKKLSDFLNTNIQSPKKKVIANEAKKYKKSNSKIASLFPKKIKTIIKNIFYSKPKMKLEERVLLNNHYLSENNKLINELGLSFVKSWSDITNE